MVDPTRGRSISDVAEAATLTPGDCTGTHRVLSDIRDGVGRCIGGLAR